MYTWRVTIANPNVWQPMNKVLNRRHAARQAFADAGFRIAEMPALYYNPRTRDSFLVKHTKESAMTLWLLKYADSLSFEFTVEQEYE